MRYRSSRQDWMYAGDMMELCRFRLEWDRVAGTAYNEDRPWKQDNHCVPYPSAGGRAHGPSLGFVSGNPSV